MTNRHKADRIRVAVVGSGSEGLGAAIALTPQEAQIARTARDGYTSPEIGAQLFLSPRTVDWYLRMAFANLGIKSRIQLATALPDA